MNDDEYARGLAEIIRMNEDEVRSLLIKLSPEIHHDVTIMTDLMREMVKTERVKLGLDQNLCKLFLSPNKDKSQNSQPDLIGSGPVAGRNYDVAAWILKDGRMEIVLSERCNR